jgi:hypothetical protein
VSVIVVLAPMVWLAAELFLKAVNWFGQFEWGVITL